MKKNIIILAFSGGLDTSFCIPYLKNNYSADVVTVTVDTGGFSKKELKGIKKKSKKLGAKKHYLVDGKKEVFEKFITYLIKGNVLRGGIYPLSVSAERIVQAKKIVEIALKEEATALAHGSTCVGNDQVRFDVAFSVLAPELEIITPIREATISRADESKYLKDIGFKVKESNKVYSVNKGLWGNTIGGGEIHDPSKEVGDTAFTQTASIENSPDKAEIAVIEFKEGIPIALNGKKLSGVELVKKLNKLASKHGLGRGIHMGDTILGIKGRIAFEAPAAVVLIKAHKELEKLVLSKQQLFWKNHLAEVWGNLLHEALYFDPIVKDIEALIDSSQKKVSGEVKVKLFKGNCSAVGCSSPYSLFDSSISLYGEESSLWNGGNAKGFCKIYGSQSALIKKVEKKVKK